MRWAVYCKILEVSRTFATCVGSSTTLTTKKFQINSTNPYVLVVTLSIIDNIKFLENRKLGFKRTVSKNKYRSGINNQWANNNLNYMIDSKFRDINRLLIISSKSGENVLKRNYFENYYMPAVDIKDFNELIDIKPFFD